MSLKDIILFPIKNFYFRNLILLVLVIGGLVYSVLGWLASYTKHNQAIEVPDVRGMQVEMASPILERSQLRYQVVDSIYSKDVRPGAVVEQIPTANSKVKENRIIFLTVNAKSALTVEIPDVIEYSSRQARGTLNSAGFNADSIRYVDYEIRDLVVDVLYNEQSVKAGERLPYGAKLVLEVGNGMTPTLQDTIPAVEMVEEDKSWME